MNILKIIVLIIMLTSNIQTLAQATIEQNEIKHPCFIPSEEFNLTSSWFIWEPYQFIKFSTELGGYNLSGLDIEIIKAITSKMKMKINYKRFNLPEAKSQMLEGKIDMIPGLSYSDSRASYGYYSQSYRMEENSIFILKHSGWTLNFQNISEFLAQIRLQNFRLGVGIGYVYADDQINNFITDETNQDIVFQYENEILATEALIKGEIDGFIADRISGSAIILNKRLVHVIDEFPLKIKSPIHVLFNKQTVPINLINSFNQEIKKFISSSEYKKIVKKYLYPILIIHTCYSGWFYIIGIIGTIAFSVSALAIGAKNNYSFFGTFILALIPSLGCGMLQDIVTTPRASAIILTPTYLYYNLVIVLVGFAAIRLLNYYNRASAEDHILQNFWSNVSIIGDSLGISTGIVTGISIVIMSRIEPIEIWGPFFSLLTAHIGVIIRDLMRERANITNYILYELNCEITVTWSLVFSIFLSKYAIDPNPDKIKIAIVITVMAAFVTRLFVYYYKISNIKFRLPESNINNS